MSDSYVYGLYLENGWPFYLGKGRGSRWRHVDRAPYREGKLYAHIRDLQLRNVVVRSKILIDNLDSEIALVIEHALISEFRSRSLLNYQGLRKPPLPAAVDFVRKNKHRWLMPTLQKPKP